MSKHTPGPWIVDPAEDLPLAVIQDTEDGEGICEIQNADQRRDHAKQEDLANARLIAKSPEMATFLEELACGTGAFVWIRDKARALLAEIGE